MSDWIPFNDGKSIGTTGSENGTIVRDEEHGLGARITLEQDSSSAPFCITCGIYGWMMHTHFVSDRDAGDRAFNNMKYELARILRHIPVDEEDADRMESVSEEISDFVSRFR